MHFSMIRKKSYKFSVQLTLDELTAVPFLNAILFAKIRLLHGGFIQSSSREEVLDHIVRWGELFSFECKILANASTGVLETCYCRISVRKELRGGRSFRKLGKVDINLAEMAGGGRIARSYLLQGYTDKHRLDNSTLNVTVSMILLSSDPCFKTPSMPHCFSIEEDTEDTFCLESDYKKNLSVFQTLDPPRITINANGKQSSVNSRSLPDLEERKLVGLTHSRNSSSTSQTSRGSGESGVPTKGGASNSGPPSEYNTFERLSHRRKAEESRILITRINPDDVVEELVRDFATSEDDSAETSGLQLFVCPDGRTALSKHDLVSPGSFHAVVVERKMQ